jgi:hypothetical protein
MHFWLFVALTQDALGSGSDRKGLWMDGRTEYSAFETGPQKKKKYSIEKVVLSLIVCSIYLAAMIPPEARSSAVAEEPTRAWRKVPETPSRDMLGRAVHNALAKEKSLTAVPDLLESCLDDPYGKLSSEPDLKDLGTTALDVTRDGFAYVFFCAFSVFHR